MALKETFYLPSVVLEVEFEGDELQDYDLKLLRPKMKNGLMKRLIAEGAAFIGKEEFSNWKPGGGADSKMESVIDAWVLVGKYPCVKNKDKNSGKVRWALEGRESITVLMLPLGGEQG